jgi:hypothetical protein
MAVACETYFEGYTVQYQWKVHNIGARWYNPQKLTSPKLSSKPGQKPATEWKLNLGMDHPQVSDDEKDTWRHLRRTHSQLTMHAGITLENLDGKYVQGLPHWVHIYAEVHMKAYRNEQDETNMIGSVHQPATKLAKRLNGVHFPKFFSLSSQGLQSSECVIIDCEIKVWQLEYSKHKEPISLKVTLPEFNLSNVMDEARRSNLFTDVTLVVADGKEFKAHKAVLAAQSPFFKTRFEGRWSDGRDPENITTRVEMTDVPEVVMDTVLSYLYTGKATDIRKIAFQVLPIAEEYGIEGLQKMCEEALAETVTDKNVVDILIHAETYNALDLKKACMNYIVSNTQTVRNSEGWSKLKSKETEIHRKLWMELVEAIAEIH